MSAMSNYLESQIIKYWFQNDATVAAKPGTVYIALFTVLPSEASASGTEVTGGGYSRVAVTNSAANWVGPTDDDATVTNGAAITFAVASGADWGEIVGVAIYDAATAGNQLFQGALSANKTVNDGDPAFSFPIGSISVNVDVD